MSDKTWSELENEAANAANLSELFDLWRAAQYAEENPDATKVKGIEAGSFSADGHISEQDYDGILFVLKEANLLNYLHLVNSVPHEREQHSWYRNFFMDGKPSEIDNNPKQKEKMGRMACYVMNQSYAADNNMEEVRNGLRKSAFINLNKRGGDNTEKKVWAYTEKYSNFIKKQIALLNPKIIICLGTYKLVSEYGLNTIDGKPVRTVDMWHTAYQMPKVTRNRECGIDRNVDAYMRKFIERYHDSAEV